VSENDLAEWARRIANAQELPEPEPELVAVVEARKFFRGS